MKIIFAILASVFCFSLAHADQGLVSEFDALRGEYQTSAMPSAKDVAGFWSLKCSSEKTPEKVFPLVLAVAPNAKDAALVNFGLYVPDVDLNNLTAEQIKSMEEIFKDSEFLSRVAKETDGALQVDFIGEGHMGDRTSVRQTSNGLILRWTELMMPVIGPAELIGKIIEVGKPTFCKTMKKLE